MPGLSLDLLGRERGRGRGVLWLASGKDCKLSRRRATMYRFGSTASVSGGFIIIITFIAFIIILIIIITIYYLSIIIYHKHVNKHKQTNTINPRP